jgi:integrase
MPTIKITKSVVDNLLHPNKGQMLYMDEELKGFGVLVSAKTKTYVSQRDIAGRTVRVTIGRHGVVTTATAKAEAGEAISLMRKGINPNEQKRAAQGRSITLQEAADLYLESGKQRSPRTDEGLRGSLRLHLRDWLEKPLAEISRKMVYDRHQRIGKKVGRYAANNAMRSFRAIYNRAMKQHEDLPLNPIINIVWFSEYSRDASIPAEQLADWYTGIRKLGNPVRVDYYQFILFSGLRRRSAAEMRWEHIDIEKGTLLIPNPKGGAKRAFVLPLSDFLIEILERRKTENEQVIENSAWVFPSPMAKSGHISEPKLKQKEKEKVEVAFSIHGLRHTWMTAANAAGLSPYDIKMLANHGLPKGDVTAGYIGAHVEALRASQQRVTDYLRSIIFGSSCS